MDDSSRLAGGFSSGVGLRVALYHPRARVGDGGITRSVGRLMAAMRDNGANAVILYDGDRSDEAGWLGVPHLGPSWARVPVSRSDVVSAFDVVVLHSAWTSHNARMAALASRSGVPYVLAPRGAYDPHIFQRRKGVKSAWWSLFERRELSKASAVHVFFEEQADHVRDLGYGGPLIVAPNGVTVPADRQWDGGSGGYLLYIGRFDPDHKGLDLLVWAIQSIDPAVRPQVRLHGPDWQGGKERIRRLVDQLDLGRWIVVADAVYGDEKWDLLCRAGAFAYPSRWEAFGNAPAEAAALGTPVLATPYPLARFLGSRGAAIVADANPASLKSGIEHAMGPQGRAAAHRAPAALAEMTWDSVGRSWMRQLARVVGARSSMGT